MAAVTLDQLRRNTRKYVTRARNEPIEVTDGSGTVAVILGVEEYQAVYAAEIRRLLARRMKEPTVPHEEVFARFEARTRRRKRKT
jgi:prevent-host-death family protein